MKLRFVALVMALAIVGAFVVSPLQVDAARPATGGSVTAPVTGTATDPTAGLLNFAGTATITQFVFQNGVLQAVGTLSGTLTDALGNVIGIVTNLPLALPLAGATGSCQILHLDLGPLDLNLLGLMVHLNEVVLDITAQSGSGNLLGNLLCAVAHLLDSNASGNALANLLNSILGAL